MKVLVVNAGSTSFKCKLYQMPEEEVLAQARVERIGEVSSPMLYKTFRGDQTKLDFHCPDHEAAIRKVLGFLQDPEVGVLEGTDSLDCVGFKAVHAGEFSGPALVNEQLIRRFDTFNDAAPAHNPVYTRSMRVFQDLTPHVPLVAHLETDFHNSIPDYAFIYSCPYDWYLDHGVRRYGFHGASLSYAAQRVPQILGHSPKRLRLVACHLGGSSSVCAVKNGHSIDTSMGFAPQAGVPMNNRCGDIDPFIIPYVASHSGQSVQDVYDALSSSGGLKGISGLSGDVRDLEEAAAKGHGRARLALEVFAYSVKKYIGAYAAAMGGLDVLSFSGGIGENASQMRNRICEGLEFLGIRLDEQLNANCIGQERVISASDSELPVVVVPADEELVVARECISVMDKAVG